MVTNVVKLCTKTGAALVVGHPYKHTSLGPQTIETTSFPQKEVKAGPTDSISGGGCSSGEENSIVSVERWWTKMGRNSSCSKTYLWKPSGNWNTKESKMVKSYTFTRSLTSPVYIHQSESEGPPRLTDQCRCWSTKWNAASTPQQQWKRWNLLWTF